MFARVPSKSIYANIIKNGRGESLPPGVLPGVELCTIQLSERSTLLYISHALSVWATETKQREKASNQF